MADDVRISYTFQMDAETPPTSPDEGPLVAFSDCEDVVLGNGSVLLLNRSNGRQTVVRVEVATALTHCSSFRTLPEHAAYIVNSMPQLKGQLADVTAVLRQVHEAGMLTSAQTVCDRLNTAVPRKSSLAPTRVCVITCDRPAAVQRLLDSMLAHAQLTPHEEMFLVDDSRDPANGARNRELVTRFNLTSPRNMRYVGAAQQRSLVDQLSAARPQDSAAIRFLIDRDRWASQASYGLARTVSLLLSVGQRCLVLDDDVLCRSVAPPTRESGLSFSGGDQRELACFGSEAELLQRASFLETDPLRGHARYLGLPLAEAIAGLDIGSLEPGGLRDTRAMMVRELHADSPVLVTQCGSWGDPGTPGSQFFYNLDAGSIARLLAAPGGLSAAAANRYYWFGCTRPNISKMAVMSQVTGLDNSHLLPPYFPVFRGEDYLFASMVLYLHPQAATLDCPWSVPHLPMEQRGGSLTPPAAAKGGLTLCARYLADRIERAAGGSPVTRLAQLALRLRELSEHSPDSLLASFRTELARQHASQMQTLEQVRKQTKNLDSGEWQDYLRDGARNVAAALRVPASPVNITEAQGKLSEAELLQRVQGVMGEFGDALAAWPGIRESAAQVTGRMLAAGEFDA